ncbi:HlyD family type I secretion periplasmic adaptor subunit, partial [Acinetobacter baumannii]
KSIEQSEKVLSPVLGRLNLFKKYQPADTNDWKSQVQEVTQSQKPIQARVILYVIVVLFICLIIWAGFAKVDEITRGEGKVIPSQQMQVI